MCLPSTFWRTVLIPMTSQFGCLELLTTQTFLSGPVKFEITRVDCSSNITTVPSGWNKIPLLWNIAITASDVHFIFFTKKYCYSSTHHKYMLLIMFMTEINIYTVRVMSIVVSLPKYTFPGQAQSSKHITSTCAHSFARNWQILFLNQRKGENDHRTYFRMNLHKRMLLDSMGRKLMTSWSPVGPASDWAIEAS